MATKKATRTKVFFRDSLSINEYDKYCEFQYWLLHNRDPQKYFCLKEDMQDAADFLDVARFGRVAKKLMLLTRPGSLKRGKQYADQEILRYAHVNNIVAFGMNKLFKARQGIEYYQYIMVGSMMFMFVKYDGANQRVYYKRYGK